LACLQNLNNTFPAVNWITDQLLRVTCCVVKLCQRIVKLSTNFALLSDVPM